MYASDSKESRKKVDKKPPRNVATSSVGPLSDLLGSSVVLSEHLLQCK